MTVSANPSMGDEHAYKVIEHVVMNGAVFQPFDNLLVCELCKRLRLFWEEREAQDGVDGPR